MVKLNKADMPKENLNPEGDELDPLNPKEEESGDDDLELLDFEESEDEPLNEEEPEDKPDEALNAYNAEMQKRGLNYNFKSWDDVAKSAKQVAKAFAKKGMTEVKPEVPETPVVPAAPVTEPSNISERLLRLEQPESQYVIDDIKKDHPGKDVYEVWNTSEFYKKEALARSEADAAKKRITTPSGGSEDNPEVDPIEQKFMNNLPQKYKQ